MVSKHYWEARFIVSSVITFKSGFCETEIVFIFLIIVLKFVPAGWGGKGESMLALSGCLWSIRLNF